MLEKLRAYWQSRGATATLRYMVDRLQFAISPPETASETRTRVSGELAERLNHEVISGLFTGMRFLPYATWGRGDRGGQLLGLYEQEVQQIIADHHANYDTLIDLGAADGYYAVGCVFKQLFRHCYAFEANESSRSHVKALASLNHVESRIDILGLATSESLLQIPEEVRQRTFVIIDIEGAEFQLVTPQLVSQFTRAFFVIELHPPPGPAGLQSIDKLKDAFVPTHELWTVTQGPRDPNRFPILSAYHDHERWLIASENRAHRMEWLVAKPRQENFS